MQWHPTLSTLLMVACEDDMSPVIQLWDLRSAAAMTPAKELLGHNKVELSRPLLACAYCTGLVKCLLQQAGIRGQLLSDELCVKCSVDRVVRRGLSDHHACMCTLQLFEKLLLLLLLVKCLEFLIAGATHQAVHIVHLSSGGCTNIHQHMTDSAPGSMAV